MTARGLALAAAVAVSLAAPAAFAEPSASAKASADVLFKQARELMKSGQYATACPKLLESERLDPAAGTLLNLAECYEKNGQTASAWATFGEAARAAEVRRRADWKATADARVKELEPALSYLTIEVDPAAALVADLTVMRDGEEVHRAEWAASIPVDPGGHTITAAASGKTSWKTTVEIKKEKDHATVRVPALAVAEPAERPTAPRTPPPAPKPASSSKTVLGLGVAGLGVAGVATGLVFGLLASKQASKANAACPGSTCIDRPGLAANDNAHTFATVSTIAVVAGAVIAAAGVAIWLWPASDKGAVAVGPGGVMGTF